LELSNSTSNRFRISFNLSHFAADTRGFNSQGTAESGIAGDVQNVELAGCATRDVQQGAAGVLRVICLT
jgi:hypothetical protein